LTTRGASEARRAETLVRDGGALGITAGASAALLVAAAAIIAMSRTA
jgi:hypothetical protein